MTTFALVEGRDPQRAALLSLFPGAGQLYNGEVRKAILFFVSGLLNLLIFLALLGANSLASNLAAFASSYHFRFDPELGHMLRELSFGGAPSYVLIGCMIAFVALAMRDAYDHARFRNDSLIYPAHLLDFPEATSGSYLIHIATLLCCFLLGLFLIVPNKPREQVTEIEFIDVPVPTTKVKTESKIKAQNAQEARGTRVTEHPHQQQTTTQRVTTSSAQRQPAETRTPSHTVPPTPPRQAQIQEQQPPPQPPQQTHIMPRTPMQPIAQPVAPTPPRAPQPQQRSVSNMPPLPSLPRQLTHDSNPAPISPTANLPQNAPSPTMPVPRSAVTGTGAPKPALAMAPNLSGFQSHAPSAVPISSSSESGTNPVPAPMARTQSTSHSDSTGAPKPAHALPSGSGVSHDPGPVAIVPNLSSQNGMNNDSSTNKVGPKGPNTIVDVPEVDFSAYMALLQRRIKSSWTPTKAPSSLVVKVQFSIHKGGELSNLHLIRTSGLSEADKRALAAVEDAAPFAPLPAGAPESVDIEFTFDYNVFQGGHGFGGKFTF
jgi:TonB family protein